MAIARGAPITMQRFSVSPAAAVEIPLDLLQDVISGRIVVMSAAWLERRGSTEMWVSELWIQRGQNISVAMSRRK